MGKSRRTNLMSLNNLELLREGARDYDQNNY